MASSAVNDGVICDVFAVVNEDSPDVDKDKEEDVGKLLEREQEWVDVVRKTLRVAVKRMEGVRGIRCRHDPLVVRLVKGLVDQWVVQTAVDPVDAEVGEHEEEGELHVIVPHARGLVEIVVNLGVSANFEEEERGGKDGHYGEGNVGLAHLEADLVLEVFRMVEGRLVEDENVRKRSEDIVDDKTEDPGNELDAPGVSTGARYVPSDEEQGHQLSAPVVARPRARVGRLAGREAQVLARWLILPVVMRRSGSGHLSDARKGAIGRKTWGLHWEERGIDGVEQEGIEGFEDKIHGGVALWRQAAPRCAGEEVWPFGCGEGIILSREGTTGEARLLLQWGEVRAKLAADESNKNEGK